MEKRKIIFIFLILGVLIIFSGIYFQKKMLQIQKEFFQLKPEVKEKVPFKIEKKIVRGNSMEPYIKDGEEVTVLIDYYLSYPIERNDIVLVAHSGREEPSIKIVKGLPQDRFQIEESKEGCWNILINGEVLRNLEEKPYCLSSPRKEILALYERDYKGVIPKDAYLVLGNLVGGSEDSTRFGLIDRSVIIGKVGK